MIGLMVIPSAVENRAASFGAGRLSGHRPIRVKPSMASAAMQARPGRPQCPRRQAGRAARRAAPGRCRRPGTGRLAALMSTGSGSVAAMRAHHYRVAPPLAQGSYVTAYAQLSQLFAADGRS